ncbi:hypothetical protein [Paraburkholderia youngii]|nr:hypothetical protein [Paraburkholderia youngii]
MNVALLSIDLAKNTFQLYGVDERGHPVLSRRAAAASSSRRSSVCPAAAS